MKKPAPQEEPEWTIDDEMRSPHGRQLLAEIREEKRKERIREFGCDCEPQGDGT